MRYGIACCNLRAQEKQTESIYMNIMIQELCYLLGASILISGYYSVLAGWHLWFSGFRLGFSVQLNQMSANKHLLCLSFPDPFFQTCYFLWISCLVQQSLKMKTNSKWSPQDIFWGKKNLFEKIRTNYNWDKMHVTIFIIYPELSKKSLIEESTDSTLNCCTEVLNFSWDSLVVGRIYGGREDHAIVLSHLRISCSLGTRCLPRVGDVWVGASVELPQCPLPGPWCQGLLAVPRGLSLLAGGMKNNPWWCWKESNGLLIKILRGFLSPHPDVGFPIMPHIKSH